MLSPEKKKKLRKICLIATAVIAVLMILSVVYLNLIFKHSVETAAPLLLGTDVTIEKVILKPFVGTFELGGIHVGNPKVKDISFTSKEVLGIRKIYLDLDLFSFFSGKLRIRHLLVSGVDVYYEPTSKIVESNISILNDNVKKLSSSDSSAVEEQKKAEVPLMKLQVDKLDLEEINTHIVLGGDAKLALPNINLIDLGKGPEGITPGHLISELISQVASSVFSKMASSTSEGASRMYNSTKESAKKLFRDVKGLFKKDSGSPQKTQK